MEKKRKRLQPSPEIVRQMNGTEMLCVEILAALDAQLIKHQENMRDRLALIPNGWRQYRLVSVLVSNLLEDVCATMPLKNLQHMQALCKTGEVSIKLRPPIHVPNYMLLREDSFAEMLNCCIANECAICLKDGKEIDRCKLRAAMVDCMPPDDLNHMGCGFRSVAVASEYGKYL